MLIIIVILSLNSSCESWELGNKA